MEKQKTISFDENTFLDFVRTRNQAVMQENSTFFYEGHEFYVGYADYLIEYLSSQHPELIIHKSYISKN